MNRFERECQVSPSLFRRTQERARRVDPLANRATRDRLIASFRRLGRPLPPRIGPSAEVVGAMSSDGWRAVLVWLVSASVR
mgnify:FL=1